MSKKNDEKIDLNKIPRDEMLKYEIAEELGLLDQVLESGWKSLSAKETGRIGGIMTRRKRESKTAVWRVAASGLPCECKATPRGTMEG